MARTRKEIKKQITDLFVSNELIKEAYELSDKAVFNDEFSLVSFENVLFDLFSYIIMIQEQLLYLFKSQIEARIAETRVHNREWYRLQALKFQLGCLLNELGRYDNSNLTVEQIAVSKIIQQAAVVRAVNFGQGALRVKVAKGADELVPLEPQELIAFQSYMNKITDAGTVVIATSNVADDLKLNINVYYDPTVLNAQGQRLDGTNDTPVIEAINNHLKSLDFNGAFVVADMNDVIQQVGGVQSPSRVQEAFSKYGGFGYNVTGTNIAGKITDIRIADAGYMKLDEANTTINYISYENI